MRSSFGRTTAHQTIGALAVTLFLAACAADAPTAPAAEFATGVSVSPGRSVPGCHPDTKLIGAITLSNADVPGTWWYITREGFDAAGINDYQGYIENLFGQSYASLDDATSALVNVVKPADVNDNGLVCAYRVRGTKANYGEPDISLYLFTVTDDDYRAK